MSGTYRGPFGISGSIDAEGYRTYKVKHRVELEPGESALTALLTPGLPLPGAIFSLASMGVASSEVDPWVWCLPEMEASKLGRDTETGGIWVVEQTFSNKPPKRCASFQFDNPLLEPQKVSGDYRMNRVEATHDIYGDPITNSAHEQIRGPQVEFDDGSPTIKIEQNVAILDLPLLTQMQNAVNAFPMWGLPARTIKISKISWERKFHGACFVYFTRKFEFDCSERKQQRIKGAPATSSFDREVVDEGTKALRGKWASNGTWELININGQPPDPSNPSHFDRYKDKNGENAKVILDGHGKPYIPEIEYVPGSGNCSECTSTPKYFVVRGFTDFEARNSSAVTTSIRGTLWNDVQLEYVSGCDWVATVDMGNSQTANLQISVSGDTATLTISFAGYTFEFEGDFSCTGQFALDDITSESQFLLNDVPDNLPTTVQISSPGGDPPGSISVQYYQEADFSLLRIPMDLQVQI